MKKLLASIREILRIHRIRRTFTRLVSITAAIVVFVTTYALVLPAITMEAEAQCGIEAHQHDDSCYKEELVCGLEEGPDHTHTGSCYERRLVCGKEAHTHSAACYEEGGLSTFMNGTAETDADSDQAVLGGTAAELPDDPDAAKAERTEASETADKTEDSADMNPADTDSADTGSADTDPGDRSSEAASGHSAVQDSSEKPVEVDLSDDLSGDLSEENLPKDAGAADSSETSADAAADTAGPGTAAEGEVENGSAGISSDSAAAGTGAQALSADTESSVPQLDPLSFNSLLNKKTSIYYHTLIAGESAVNSKDIADWKPVKEDTRLGEQDILRVYFAYTIPAGSMNETNDTVRYRLPANLHLPDKQIKAINETENGIAAQAAGGSAAPGEKSDEYYKYLGAEAVEGTRTPSDDRTDYLKKHGGEEFISAIVRVENVSDDAAGNNRGQELVFTFVPYTVQKNRNAYSADGSLVRQGEKAEGWFALDLSLDQIDWTDAEGKEADSSSSNDNEASKEKEAAKDNEAEKDNEAAKVNETEKDNEAPQENEAAIEKEAEIIFVGETEADAAGQKKAPGKISIKLRMVQKGEAGSEKKDSGDKSEETAEKMPSAVFEESISVRSGSLRTDSEIMDQVSPKTKLTVHAEADEGTFPEGTTMSLSAVTGSDLESVGQAVENAVAGTTRGFHAVDITFHDRDGKEIEPLKPIRVTITSDAIRRAVEDDSTAPLVVHVENKEGRESEEESDKAPLRASVVETIQQDTQDGQDTQDEQDTQNAVQTEEKGPAEEEEQTGPAGDPAETEPGTSDIAAAEESGENSKENRGAQGSGYSGTDAITFESDAFSIYAIVYTVDFKYEVDGKEYEFSLPGGGFVSFSKLIEALGIGDTVKKDTGKNAGKDTGSDTDEEDGRDFITTEDTETSDEAQTGEETRQFLADVEKVEFSDPGLVWVGKTDAGATVGVLKETNGLEVEYSADLTEEEIEKIDAQTVEAGDWALISMRPFTSEETLTVTMKDGAVFTVKVTDAQIRTHFISDSGQLFEVTVTYDETAGIPDGSTLKVTEFEEGSAEYDYARKSVLADKKERGEQVDLNSFHLAALDISILNPGGEEIEPASAVQVDIHVRELPGVEDLSEVADTLAVQHHVEVEDGVVVETVFGGDAEASFKLETNEAVAAEGVAVDPDSVSEEDFAAPGASTSHSDEDTDHGEMDVSFQTPVFSTFTVTWGGTTASNAATTVKWQTGNGGPGSAVRAQMTVHYVDTNGNPITRPSGIDNNYNINNLGEGIFDNTVTINAETLARSISGYTYQSAYTIVNGKNQPVTSVKATREGPHSGSYFGYSYEYYENAVTYYNNETSVRTESNTSDFYALNAGDLYLVYSGTVAGPHATIHYVDEDGNDLAVSNGSISSTTLLNNYAYLIYDIEGGEYEYKEAYIRKNSTDTKIKAYLKWNGSNWRYTTNGSSWSNVSDNDDIYVVYKKKTTPTNGGTPTLVELAEDQKPEAPTITKGSAVNGDGTNTLSLSVTSHTKPREVLKLADVIVIFDRSGSMKSNINNSYEANSTANRRMTLLQNAVNKLADDLIGDDSQYIYTDPDGVKHKQIEMSLVSFSTEAKEATAFTDKAATFKGWVNDLTPDGGTNWEQALQKANEAAVDAGRATFVIFVTDGEPTFRMSRMTDEDSSLSNDMHFPNTQTDYGTYYLANNVYGTGNSDEKKDGTNYGRNYRAALAQALSIVNKNKNLFMIGVGPEVGNLDQFNTDAGADGYYPVKSSESLESAFEDIKKRIAAMAGYSDIQISDGITDLTQTVRKSSLVDFVEDDFTYYKGAVDHYENVYAVQEDVDAGLAANVGDVIKKIPVVNDWETWDPASEDCAEAKYENGAVVWDMGSDFMPEDGYTYQVRFKVWPSQEAYDLLADLNNGVKSYDSLSDEEKEQIKEPAAGSGGMYTLKTNSDTSYNYKEATTVDGTVTPGTEDVLNPPGSFEDVDPLLLTTTPLKVRKQWHNNYVDSRELTDSITMKLYGVDPNGRSHDFKEITLTREDGWYAEENYISYGLVTYTTDSDAKIYETGHDFTLRETDDEAHYYELTAGVFRPMFINGTPTMLERIDTAPDGMGDSVFHYSDGSHHYYRLDGKVYRDTGSDILIIATNSHRSYMDISKTVTTDDGVSAVSDQLFEFEVTFTVPNNIDNYATEKYIFASVRDENGNDLNHLTQLEKTDGFWVPSELAAVVGASVSAYSEYDTKQRIIVSGEQFTMKIKPGWNVRFVNLPKGTTYTIKEVNIPEGYEFVNAEVSGTQWIANMDNGTDTGEAVGMTGLPSDSANTGISGTITEANARYNTTYTNRALTKQVKILKTSQDGTTPLSGAVFSLYTESGYDADPKSASKTGLSSDGNGRIDLGGLAYGKYYLEEISAPEGYILLSAPVEITVDGSGVTYIQSDSNLPLSGNGISYDEAAKEYTLTVTNNAGYELPSTGGPGTRTFTLLGAALIAGAGLLLRKRREPV